MPPANDFHLRGRRFHAPGARLQHGLQQVPAAVGHEFQQGLVHRGERHFGACRRLAVGQLRGDRDLRLAAHRVARLIGGHAHIELVGLRAHADFCHAQPKRRLAQVDQCGGGHVLAALVPERGPPLARRLVAPGEERIPRHLAQAPAQGQHAHVHVGPPALLDLEPHRRILPVELHHLRVQDAFALHRQQGRGKAKRHAHLELRGFARLVGFLLGQQVDAVVVLATEPELALACDVHRAGGLNALAVGVARGDHQLHFARLAQLRLAQQQAARVALAAAHDAQLFHLLLVVVGVEATHHALAAGGGDVRKRRDAQRHVGCGLAGQVQRQRLKADLLAGRHPAFGLDARDHVGRPHRGNTAQRLHLAVGVGVAGLQQQLLRLRRNGNLLDGERARAVAVQRHRQLVGNDALVLRGLGLFLAFVAAGGAVQRRRARRLEAEAFKVAKAQRLVAHQGRHAHRQVGRTAA